ncbi:MAG: sugar ABC transporter ATP-binding protein [Spirochaetales bacterium]|nr:sugar ABC transporter ATP-binding protein [Spirochaetales bacterium]
MSDYILQVENIKKSFGGVRALKGVSLNIKKGEIHSLAGENGCGNSTLIKIISGFYEADEGLLRIDGKEYSKISPMDSIRQGIQVIYQDFSVFPNLTVMENLAFNMELMSGHKFVNYKRMRSIAKTAISRINFKVDLDERVEHLPVADRQLIAISRALLYDARLIIMDEPTTALTKKEVQALFKIIKQLQEQGIAILFVSHKLDEVFEISEGYTILRNGENVISGVTRELTDEKFAYYMTGREFSHTVNRDKPETDETVLEVENLSMKGAYEDISFRLGKGEILGITGLLGSGRTELVQSLFGINSPDEGIVKLNGENVHFKSVKEAMDAGIGYVPSDRLTEGLFLPQSIRLNTIISKIDKVTSKRGFLDTEQINSEVDHWIEDLAVAASDPEQPVQTLSGGNQQKVMLSRWLANKPTILILNGPTVGVDIGSKFDILALLRRLSSQGLSVVIISDDLPEILSVSHRILVMREGRIVEELVPETSSEQHLDNVITGVE